MLAVDPKRMELALGRALFDPTAPSPPRPESTAEMLNDAVADMRARTARFAATSARPDPTVDDPFPSSWSDEMAFVTAYLSDRELLKRGSWRRWPP